MALSSYRRVLQEKFSRTDTNWEYKVHDLPQPSTCNAAGYIKSCSFTSSAAEQKLSLSLIKLSPNRATSEHSLASLMHVSFSDFRLQTDSGDAAPFRESAEYIATVLKSGIQINDTHYHFYGHSQSQLKSRSCFLISGSKEQVNRLVDSLGDFSKIKTVAKKVKRIGLLFSTAHVVMDINPVRVRDIGDIEYQDYIFTDGCGFISRNLAQILTRKRPIIFRNRRYHPTVFQIRYRGYKGVVIVEPRMDPGIWLELRKSMKKFSGGKDLSFAVVEFSKPYSYGYLNDEVVLLLHSLGVTHEILLRKQDEHLNTLSSATAEPQVAFRLLNSLGQHEVAEKLLLEGMEAVKRPILRIVDGEYGKMLSKRSEQKCRILVPKSRLLFGVCDPRDILREGQCFVKVTHEDGVARALTGTWILIARNPCLHPGDLQKFWAVARPELDHLVDCVVFPTQGKRPAADLMSGGDLDGDTFFVCWDADLVPATISEAAEYPAGKEQLQFRPITHDDRIDYFAHTSSIQLGRIKKLYLQWARFKGSMSSQCQELNRLFSQCVDANKIKIPDRLLKLPEGAKNLPFVLDILHEAAHARIQAFRSKLSSNDLSSAETLESILSEDSNMSQFELAKLTLRWCHANRAQFADFWMYFDPRKLAAAERAWLLAQLPPAAQTASLVMNDLLHSNILDPSDLQQFGLQHPGIRWRLVFNSERDRLANLMDVVDRVFHDFSRKLLVLHIHDRLSVAIYIPTLVERADECAVDDRVRLFSFPHGQKMDRAHRSVVPSKVNSRLYYDQSSLQLYEGQRGNTFIFLTRSPNDDSRYRSLQNRGQQARARQSTIEEGVNHDWRASIALNKFSQGLATHIGRLYREGISGAEIYVIGNDDTRSYQQLDLWLEQVDTERVHLNFEPPEDQFEVLRLDHTDWDAVPDDIQCILRDQKVDRVLRIQTAQEMTRLLEILWEASSVDVASELYQRYLGSLDDRTGASSKVAILRCMLAFLDSMPELVIHFCRLSPWERLPAFVRQFMQESVLTLLRALILCSNNMGGLVVRYLRALLEEATYLSVKDLRSIIELTSLTVSDIELGMDVMLEGLGPCSTSLSLDTPLKTDYLLKSLTGIALDHIEETCDQQKVNKKAPKYPWKFEDPLLESDKGLLLKTSLRIDAPKNTRPAIGDHVRFHSIGEASNTVHVKPGMFEAVVEMSVGGDVAFRCIRRPPSFYQRCWWNMENCSSFVTSKTMMDAVVDLMDKKKACCGIFDCLFPRQLSGHGPVKQPVLDTPRHREDLNPSQHAAVDAGLSAPMTLIWGPPGCGKTHTIVSLLQELLKQDSATRLLVAAPTHNAVDNVMRQYIKRSDRAMVRPLRVSTDAHKVSPDLLPYTCDGMLSQDINANLAARRKAQKQIAASRFIFSTCVGAGLGLLRSEAFDTVVIDEASQQTEPASLVPLVKGCRRVVLVGDHVQLRATVGVSAAALGLDVSLFERLWVRGQEGEGKREGVGEGAGVRRVMLDTQYRMHPRLCAFPSREFYEGRLLTAGRCEDIPVVARESCFDWPGDGNRSVFIQCDNPEDLGMRSKSNGGQARMCQEVIRRVMTLRQADKIVSANSIPSTAQRATARPQAATTGPTASVATEQSSIAILTPYTRQLELLRRLIPEPDIRISTIDGFQGQEADLIIYVTVRCNEYRELGFLKDLRRINVAITRPKAGLVIIGDKATLTMGRVGEELDEAKRVWERLIGCCTMVRLEDSFV